MIKPKALQKGDLIAIAAPAGPFDRGVFMHSIKKLQGLGFKVTFRKDIFSKERYFAGSDTRRAEELYKFFADPGVRAIFFARGGYGTQRILHLLDIDIIKANPKVVLGYSDITALHSYLYRHGIGGTFYGMNIARHFKHAAPAAVGLMLKAVTEAMPLGGLVTTGARTLKGGLAEGPIVGGCLSLIAGGIGTNLDLPAEDCILFLEDVLEPVYKYDRMLMHLKLAGKLRGVKAIIFGTMTLPKGENKAWLKKMIEDVLGDFPGPIVTDFPAGHLPFDKLFVTLPLGVRSRLVAGKKVELAMLEPALL
jgi:muramoyltetrapeptide carboxypeptidase